MKDWWIAIVCIMILSLVQAVAGLLASLWLGTVILAYCIGALWGAGGQIRKCRDHTKK